MRQSRARRGFVYGVLATVAMSVPMVLGFLSGLSPLPEPVPKAIVGTVLGASVPRPLVVVLAVGGHLAYGGLFGALLAALAEPVTIPRGIALGAGLWTLMGVAVLPLLGWGLFGTAVAPAVAVVTFLFHLVYGTTLAWALDRRSAGREQPSATAG